MNTKPKIVIGIAAYNAERNIGQLLNALISQDGFNSEIQKIVVHSDNSSDDTVKITKGFSDSRIHIIDNKDRSGFAGSFKNILSRAGNCDAVLVLNDDITISDKNFVDKMSTLLLKSNNIGLITGNPVPFPGTNFVQKAVISGFNAYYRMRYEINNGNNKWTCDGKVLLLTKAFLNKIIWPKNNNDLGNVDAYMYFSCLSNNIIYEHIKEAKVYFKTPSTVSDYIKWNARNNSNKFLLLKTFGDLVQKEYLIPWRIKYRYMILESIKNPFGAIFLYTIKLYTAVKARQIAKNFDSKWEVVETTKEMEK